uniref:Uncharacterized protein n=1 Tax=Sphaerodactylus townsendi TaxID=933632 RepID=A0ACB8G8A6_9SAUR
MENNTFGYSFPSEEEIRAAIVAALEEEDSDPAGTAQFQAASALGAQKAPAPSPPSQKVTKIARKRKMDAAIPDVPAQAAQPLLASQEAQAVWEGILKMTKDFTASVKEDMMSLLLERGLIQHPYPPQIAPGPSSFMEGNPPGTLERGKTSWPAKAACRKGRVSPPQGYDATSDSGEDSEKEVVFLSDEEVEEKMQVVEPSFRFFKPEDYSYLLSKCLSALHLKDISGEGKGKEKSGTKSTHAGNQKPFPGTPPTEEVFPFPEFFENQIMAEWEKPAANRRVPEFLKKLYALPAYADYLQVPVIDAPIAALQSSGLVSGDGEGKIRDRIDRRVDQLSRQTHEAIAMAIRASAAASIVSRASIVWARKVIQLLPESERRLHEGASRMLMAASFSADATVDTMTFLARATGLTVATRRLLWLRAWPTDFRSKSMVAAFPFGGGKLFGEALDRILVETKGKNKAMPRTLLRNDRQRTVKSNGSFRSQHALPRFRQDNRKPAWSSQLQTYKERFSSKSFSVKGDRSGGVSKANKA